MGKVSNSIPLVEESARVGNEESIQYQTFDCWQTFLLPRQKESVKKETSLNAESLN